MGIKRSFLSFVFIALLAAASSGCVYLAVGAIGVVGGYVVSPDTVAGQSSRSMEETYAAAKQILGIMGQIQEDNQSANGLVATISGARVTVSVAAINVSVSKLTVKARKAFMPKIDLAQDVYAKIVNSMEK
ncbi:MAG: hypothetical protein HQL18_04040 [Candidatus Omnitrophica bacterium]|nr:hypothetical protein [Candidatus Omnitrophota bacterium]